jgi:transposase
MARSYRPVLRDQPFLVAPDMRDWLPADHLVWFVLEALAAVDLAVFHRGRRTGGVGRRGFDPDMLAGLLVYAYCQGVRSSRQIERLCETDVAFRIACGDDRPDHSTLARFRKVHQDAFVGVFTQVLRVAAAAGLGRFGTVAIDGTKIAGNASGARNRDRDWLETQARLIVADAEQTDAEEEARLGPDDRGDGDRTGPALADAGARGAAIAAALAALDAQERAAEAARAEAERVGREQAEQRLAALAAGQKVSGRAPASADRVAEARLLLERARAQQQAAVEKWQARAARAAAQGRRLRGKPPVPVEDHCRVRAARDRLTAAERRAAEQAAAQPTEEKKPQANLTDPDSRLLKTRRGWIQGYNAQIAATADQLIVALDAVQDTNDQRQLIPMMTAARQAADLFTEATGDTGHTLGTVLADAGYASHTNLTAEGPDRLVALGTRRDQTKKATDQPASGPPPDDATPQQAMDHRLRTPEGAALYKRRGATVEPAIGNLKKLLPTFSMRGLNAARNELHLAAAAFNLLKIYRHGLT